MLTDKEINDLANQDYQIFVKSIVRQLAEWSVEKDVVNQMLEATTNHEIKQDLIEALSDIRQDKIDKILEE